MLCLPGMGTMRTTKHCTGFFLIAMLLLVSCTSASSPTVIPEHTATPTGTAMPTPEPTPTTAPASPSPTQIPGRADLYRVVQPPEHMAYIWWQWELHEFRELMIDFTIHNDPGNFSDRHGLYLMLCYSSISDQGFYLGLQTDASDPDLQRGRGKALIFSRWGTRNLELTRFGGHPKIK